LPRIHSSFLASRQDRSVAPATVPRVTSGPVGSRHQNQDEFQARTHTPTSVRLVPTAPPLTLSAFIQANQANWQVAARANAHGMHLVRATPEGQPLRDAFGVHAILINRHGKAFVRYEAARSLGHGGNKNYFEAEEYPSRKKYAWAVLGDNSILNFYDQPTMTAFRRLIENHPSFNHTGEFALDVGHVDGVAVSIDDLYDGDALDLRVASPTHVLNGAGIIKLAEGVKFMHDNGFAHRDVKPDNILLENRNPVWHDYDFVDRTEPHDAMVPIRGTPGYIAPEYAIPHMAWDAVRRSTLPKSDIFSFACALLWDLDGTSAFLGYDSGKQKENWARLQLLARGRGLLAEGQTLQVSHLTQHREVLHQAWLDDQTAIHQTRKPTSGDGQPYFRYRCLLWAASQPDPVNRPDSAMFLNALRFLGAAGELPA